MNSTNYSRLAEEYQREKELKLKNEMHNKIRDRLVNSNLPKLATVNEANNLECKVCKNESKDAIAFNKHLSIPRHIQAVEALKKKANEKKQKKAEVKLEVGVKRKPEVTFTLDQTVGRKSAVNNKIEEEEEDEEEGGLIDSKQNQVKVDFNENKAVGEEDEEEEKLDLPEGFFDNPGPKKPAPRVTIQDLKKDFDQEFKMLQQLQAEEEEKMKKLKIVEEEKKEIGEDYLNILEGKIEGEDLSLDNNKFSSTLAEESEFDGTKKMIEELRKKKAEAKMTTKSKMKVEKTIKSVYEEPIEAIEDVGDFSLNDWKKRKL